VVGSSFFSNGVADVPCSAAAYGSSFSNGSWSGASVAVYGASGGGLWRTVAGQDGGGA
jgi:hypothetical protein